MQGKINCQSSDLVWARKQLRITFGEIHIMRWDEKRWDEMRWGDIRYTDGKIDRETPSELTAFATDSEFLLLFFIAIPVLLICIYYLSIK